MRRQDGASFQRIRRQRPLPLPRDDSIHDGDFLALQGVGHLPGAISKKERPVQIKAGAPDGIVAMPTAFNLRSGIFSLGKVQEPPDKPFTLPIQSRPSPQTVDHIQQMLRQRDQPMAVWIIIALAGGHCTLAMVRQEFLVAVDADQVFKATSDPSLFVGFELWHVDDQIGIQDFFGHQVPVPARAMMPPHQARVIHGDPKLFPIGGNRFQEAIRAQIHQFVLVFRAQLFSHLFERAFLAQNRASKIFDHQRQAPVLEFRNHGTQAGIVQQPLKITALQGRISQDHQRGLRQKHIFQHRTQNGRMRNHALHAALPQIFVQYPVGFDHDVAAGFDQHAKRIPCGRPKVVGIQAHFVHCLPHGGKDGIGLAAGASLAGQLGIGFPRSIRGIGFRRIGHGPSQPAQSPRQRLDDGIHASTDSKAANAAV